ncbi:class 1b ribonucleoside-diphosphate reductase subunit beta [Turicibacter sp. TJ11]|uniref:class 1b ribonucleoside-diphosphate reductase subunit beta n=1 Tax=Turicibacter sp. TJ11 TaxID=2806443 RepID=UPI001F238B81|nr:class 1b ribonucleoside-diphosphate reductase subunit beta [Turicibacter sp. TJ11]
MKKQYQAVNWNAPDHQFYDELYLKQTEQFWLPEEIPVSEDKSTWETLDPKVKQAYERILAGLTLLDTEQSTGIQKIAEKSSNLFVKSILALFAGFESIHARSYSTIFQTLCTTERIDELFLWVEETKLLQQKVDHIMKTYYTIENDESLFMSMVGCLCLEGICFYSGFFLPLWLAGQGQMVNSGEIINLILRDEKLHTVGVGFFAQELYQTFDQVKQEELKAKTYSMIQEIYDIECEYSNLLYQEVGMLEEVKVYIQYNVNYALQCLNFEPLFQTTEQDINPIVMNGISTETKNHDFFSTKGNGYIKTTKVEALQDSDFEF